MARGWTPSVVPHPWRKKSIDSFTRTPDETIKLWDSIGSRKSLLKGCLLQFSPDRKQIIPIDGATVEKNNPKPWTSFCDMLREYGSDQCLFGYFDCSLMISSGEGSGLSDRPMNRKIFVVWVPSKATIRDKMLSSASRANFKNKIGQPEYEWQLFNEEDLEIQSRIEFGLRKVRGKITKFEGEPLKF